MDVPAKAPKLRLSHRYHHILQSSNDFLPLLGSTIYHPPNHKDAAHHWARSLDERDLTMRGLEVLSLTSSPFALNSFALKVSPLQKQLALVGDADHRVRDIRGAQLATLTIVGKKLHHLGVEDAGPCGVHRSTTGRGFASHNKMAITGQD